MSDRDRYDGLIEDWYRLECQANLSGFELSALATLLRTLAQALKPVEVERDRLKEQNASLIRGAQRLRCPAHALDASNGWGCPVCVFELRQKLAEALGLLAEIADDATDGPINAGLNSVQAVLRFMAQSPAAPPKECDGTEAGLGCDCGQVHEPPEPHSFEPGPSSWGTGCLICKMPKEDHAPASAHSAKP